MNFQGTWKFLCSNVTSFYIILSGLTLFFLIDFSSFPWFFILCSKKILLMKIKEVGKVAKMKRWRYYKKEHENRETEDGDVADMRETTLLFSLRQLETLATISPHLIILETYCRLDLYLYNHNYFFFLSNMFSFLEK